MCGSLPALASVVHVAGQTACAAQVHGFPKVMGVLTHLDGFRDVKRLKKTKKALKHRFWAEIYQGAFCALPGPCSVSTTSCSLLPCLGMCRRSLAGLPATGAKLFYLSGMRNGKYLQREVLNLARFIAVQKFRPLTWRQAHPFLLADRFEVRRSPLHHSRRARGSMLMRSGAYMRCEADTLLYSGRRCPVRKSCPRLDALRT